MELLAPVAGERILDLGCGDGALTEKLVARGCAVIGVDASAAQVEAARRRGLDARGFVVHSIALIPRPTLLPGDVGEWLETFAQAFLDAARDRAALLDAVRAELRPDFCDADGRWTADYVRLRFAAAKPG